MNDPYLLPRDQAMLKRAYELSKQDKPLNVSQDDPDIITARWFCDQDYFSKIASNTTFETFKITQLGEHRARYLLGERPAAIDKRQMSLF